MLHMENGSVLFLFLQIADTWQPLRRTGLNKANSLTLWEIKTGEQTRMLERVTEHGDWISIFRGRALICSSKGSYFVINFLNTDRDTVRLWNEETLVSFTSEMPIISAAVSLDRHLFATGGWDKKVTLWNVETQEPFCTLEGHTGKLVISRFRRMGLSL